MQITLQLDTQTAHEIRHRQPPGPAARELLSAIDALEVTLDSVHPGVSDPELGRYYSVEVVDAATGEQIRERLARCVGVEAAYIKPADEMP